MNVHIWLHDNNEISHHRLLVPARALQANGYNVTIGGLGTDAFEADAIIAQSSGSDYFNYWVWVLRQAGMPVFIDVKSGPTHPRAVERAITIDLPTYVEQWQIDFAPRAKAQPVIGWVGTSKQDLHSIRLLLRKLEKTHNTQFRSVGINYNPGVKSYKHVYRPKTHDDYYRLLNFDIAVVPLVGNDYNPKLVDTLMVEYAAAGVPVVATEAPGTRFIEYGSNGYTVGVNESRDWSRGLERLLDNKDLRDAMSQTAKGMAQGRSIDQNLHLYERLLLDNMSGGGRKRRAIIERIDGKVRDDSWQRQAIATAA